MSGFDDPFGENPFADPAIQQATRVTTNIQNSLEDYNPFEPDDVKHKLQINSGNNAAVVQPLSQNTPPTAASTSIQITTEELQVTLCTIIFLFCTGIYTYINIQYI